MPLQLTWKKVVIGALALSLVFGSGIVAPSAANAAALTTPFTDISAGHWAEKHVAKLALQGIITGYTKGDSFVFLPSQTVTQQEAVLMALRFAGLEDKADLEAIIGFPTSFVVSNYYKSYINLAFTEGLLDQSVEYELAAKDSAAEWGTKPASREWVTKLMIRAIGEEDQALLLQDSASAFSDASLVDDLYKGYVNAASELELVKGVTADKFDPKASVTRASLATLFSRAQSLFPVDYEGQANGIVTNVSDKSISVFSDDEETSYTLSDDTLYYHYNTETPITKDELLEYGDVTVIAKDGEALYVEVKGDKQYVKTFTGTLDRVIADDDMLYVWVDDKPVEIYYNDSVQVQDSEGNALELSDIKRDSQIKIVQDTFRDSPLALQIIATPQSSASTAIGTYYGTTGELITIMEGTVLVSKFMADEVTVEIEGMSNATLDDLLKEADQVELTLNDDDQVTKIKVSNRDVEIIAGAQIASYVRDKMLLTIVDSSGNNAQALYFTDKTKIEDEGSELTLSEAKSLLSANRKVIISYTGNTIVSLQFVSSYEGTLVSMDAKDKTLTAKLTGGASITLPYSSAVKVQIAGTTSESLTDLKAGDLLTLDLNSSQDTITTVKKHSTTQYEVVSVDTSEDEIRLKNTATASFDLSVDDADLLNEVGAALTLKQITAGTIVNVDYIGNDASAVRTATVTYGKVQSVTSSSVTIADLSGNTITYPSSTGFQIIEGASQGTAVSLLSVGDYVEVIKLDSNEIQFTIAVGESREFTSYDSVLGQVWTLKVSDSDNRNYFNVTSTTKYTQNGSTITLSSLKAGDDIVIYGFRNNAIEIVKQ